MLIRRMLRVVKKQQLSGVLVNFGMRRHSIDGRPAFNAFLFQSHRIEAIAFTALPKGCEHLTGVHNHVG